MPLHPEIAKILSTLPAPPAGPPEPSALRSAEEAEVPAVADRTPAVDVQGSSVPGPAGPIPIRIYRAGTVQGVASGLVGEQGSGSTQQLDQDTTQRTVQRVGQQQAGQQQLGVIVYLHGGAFFLGSLNTHDEVARRLAFATGLTVVGVGYRRAPENPFPAGLDDCYAVLRWVAGDGAETLGWDHRTLALAGDSSGGNFVAALVARAHDDGFDAVTAQVLYYPSLDLDFDESRYASLQENARGYGLETAALKPFNAFYIDSGADPADPRVSPIKREDLSGLPPALILTGEYDPLRDEGELYGQRLREARVEATVTRYAGAGHGFVQHFGWLPEYGRAYDETAEFLRRQS